jgi:hypothetical protein
MSAGKPGAAADTFLVWLEYRLIYEKDIVQPRNDHYNIYINWDRYWNSLWQPYPLFSAARSLLIRFSNNPGYPELG